MIRHEMKEKLEQQLLQTVTLSENEVQWVKPGKEILVEGKMFDVKSFSSEKGQYRFTGLFDHEETALVNHLEKNLKKTNESGSWLISALFHLLQSVYSTDGNDTALISTDKKSDFYLIYIHILSPFKTIPTPPPQA